MNNIIGEAIRSAELLERDDPYSFRNVLAQVIDCARRHKITDKNIYGLLPTEAMVLYSPANFNRDFNEALIGFPPDGVMREKIAVALLAAVKKIDDEKVPSKISVSRPKLVHHKRAVTSVPMPTTNGLEARQLTKIHVDTLPKPIKEKKNSKELDASKEPVLLMELFQFISDFQKKTGYGLSDIYQWLDPDIEYGLEEAKNDYDLFKAQSADLYKTVAIEIAESFVSVCKNFKHYGGGQAQSIDAVFQSPIFSPAQGRVSIESIRAILETEKERTHISSWVLWKLLPDYIVDRYNVNTYMDKLKTNKDGDHTISNELMWAIRHTYSKIPGRNQPIAPGEGVVVPPFGDKHHFSISTEVALGQLKEKLAPMKAKGLFVTGEDFIEYASEILGANVKKIFDRHYKAVPRLRVAICLALLDGKEIPEEVLDVHRCHFELSSRFKALHKSDHIDHSKNDLPEGMMHVSKIRSELNAIFERAALSPAVVYTSLSNKDRMSMDFRDVVGWFDGSVNTARKEHVSVFLHQAMILLEQDRSLV